MNPRDPAQLDHYEELACSLIAYRRELATIEAGLIEAQRAAYEERTAAERKTIVDGDKYAELAQRFRLGAVSAEEALRTAARDPAIEAEAERLRASLSKMGVFVTIERARERSAFTSSTAFVAGLAGAPAGVSLSLMERVSSGLGAVLVSSFRATIGSTSCARPSPSVASAGTLTMLIS